MVGDHTGVIISGTVTAPRDLNLFSQILQAISLIDARMRTAGGGGLEPTVSDAILWRLSVIGQVAARLSEDAQAAHPLVDWGAVQRLQLIAAGSLGGLTRDEVWRNVDLALPPLRAAAEREMNAAYPDHRDPGEASPRVLLVDDDPDIRRILDLLLTRAGYSVLQAADGEQGLELARRSSPDAVIADIQLPKLDGVQLVGHLREMRALDQVPILLFTGKPPLAGLDVALGMDKVRYMSKGDPKRVIKALSEMLEREVAPPAPSAAPAADGPVTWPTS